MMMTIAGSMFLVVPGAVKQINVKVISTPSHHQTKTQQTFRLVNKSHSDYVLSY